MAVWLSPDDVAERLGVGRRTAITMMYQMRHSVIGGTERKRIRVSEEALDAWMEKHSAGTPVKTTKATGTARRLERR